MRAAEQVREGTLVSELWQFAALVGGIFVAAVLWLFIIYLPARTMEYSHARRSEAHDRHDTPEGSG